ncbi:PREDICTED: probable disease resistance protein At5g63020 [Populus euphratica]|uniref:Probable disease resistance protein At5g63020 n=1 Tax=Populus euphratica TaxID=75702 RepID=A0AAJ6U6N9_POPEU|nr:PREDICTED: probable disease resistance protein At5g63020 [Populus euphratica]
MANIPIGEVLTFLWNVIKEPVVYIDYEQNLRILETKMDELLHLKNDLTGKVQMAEVRSTISRVTGWVSRVERMITEVNELTNQAAQEMQKNCFGSCCPKNCWSRYKIGKKIDEKLRAVFDHIEKGEKYLSSVSSPVESVMGCLREVENSTIGIYGPGGAGKTALLIQVSNNLLSSHLPFDFVIWVVASQDPDSERIQGDIGKEIGFLEDRWKGKSFQEKAREVFSVLSQKKFVLLVDDLRKPVDLAEVGVPSRENGSKLVFTTSSEELCNSMGAEEKIRVGGLAWEKAWKLFQEKVGEDTLNIHPKIPELAETIAKMCNGLPLALITVGRAMAFRKTLLEWHHSIEALSRATAEFSRTPYRDFVLLKFGYDSLRSDKVRSCFLYCALFPDGFCINKSYLIDYWIGEGFLGAYSDAYEARTEGHNIIDILTQACLLEDEGRDVKMHQVIRDMVLWIDSRNENPVYLVESGTQLADAPEVGKWEMVRRVSLMANNIQNLSKAPRCNDLYLNLSKTRIRQLPFQLKNLVKLKCLNLEHTSELRTIPMQVISNFSSLTVLRMVDCGSSDSVVGDGVQTGGPGSLARDLQCLKHLNLLTITIRSQYSLQTFASFNKFLTATQALSLQKFQHTSSLDISLLEGMNCLDDLEFIDCSNLKDLSINNSSITSETSFKSLRRVSIVNCSKLEDLTWLTLAPNIKFLMISRCSKMEEIIRQEKSGQRNLKVFEELEFLRLVSLPQLKVIYPDALPFPSLKEIFVDDCPNLRKLPLNSNSAKEHGIVIQGWEDWWRRLEWEDEAAQHTFLPSFKGCLY